MKILKTWEVEMERDCGLSPVLVIGDELRFVDGALIVVIYEQEAERIRWAASAGSWLTVRETVVSSGL